MCLINERPPISGLSLLPDSDESYSCEPLKLQAVASSSSIAGASSSALEAASNVAAPHERAAAPGTKKFSSSLSVNKKFAEKYGLRALWTLSIMCKLTFGHRLSSCKQGWDDE